MLKMDEEYDRKDYVKRALDVQFKLIDLSKHKDIKVAQQSRLHYEIKKFMKIVMEQQADINQLKGAVNALKDKKSYADVVRKPADNRSRSRSRSRVRKTHAVLVKPKKVQSSEQTKVCIQSEINPKDLQVGVSNARPIRQGGIFIETDSSDEVDKLIAGMESKEEIKSNYIIEKAKMRKPHILIYDVDENLTKEEI